MPPQGGDPPCATLQSGPSELQSTPPHGRRRNLPYFAALGIGVSIHASAREATGCGPPPAIGPQCFNPRLRTGGDLSKGTPLPNKTPVSIHASAREATRRVGFMSWMARLFQSTPPHGRRRKTGFQSHDGGLFQSTPPHGRRRRPPGRRPSSRQVSIHASAREATAGILRRAAKRGSFNPRLRTGGDVWAALLECASQAVSIHASAREAT